MKLSLTDFEHKIDPVILKRGQQYYKKGHVTAFDQMSHGEYEAIVEGTETYTVRLTLRDEAVTEWVCDCPYDMGPVCKHVVAALYYVQREMAAPDEPVGLMRLKPGRPPKNRDAAETKPQKAKAPTRKTIAEQIEETLDAVTHDELKSYIRELCDRDREFRQLFLARYARLTGPVTKEFYAGQIRTMVDAAAGRHRFVEYHKARGLGNAIYEILSNAGQACAQGDHAAAMQMAYAVLEQSHRALGFTDDSDGIMGSLPDRAIEVLFRIVEARPGESLRKELFDYAADAFARHTFGGWDWHWDMARLAISLVESDGDRKKIEGLLALGKTPVGDYEYRRMQDLTLELLHKTGGKPAEIEYLEKNIDNPDFRARLIERAIAAKDYEKAIRLANDGVARDEKARRGEGNPDRWRDHLLTIFLKRGDRSNAAVLLRRFIVTRTCDHYRGFEFCYKELKRLTSPDQWQRSIEGMVKEINANLREAGYYRLTQLYIWELQWDKLFDLLSANPSLRRIAEVERYLSHDYAAELAAMYRTGILDYMKQATGREHYREACRYLRRMIKLGARAEALGLVAELRTTYKARRALQEELDNV